MVRIAAAARHPSNSLSRRFGRVSVSINLSYHSPKNPQQLNFLKNRWIDAVRHKAIPSKTPHQHNMYVCTGTHPQASTHTYTRTRVYVYILHVYTYSMYAKFSYTYKYMIYIGIHVPYIHEK